MAADRALIAGDTPPSTQSLTGTNRRPYSGEVDVVLETSLSGVLQEPKQRRPFGSPGPAADDDHDAVMELLCCEMEKVVPVAGQQHAAALVGKLEHLFVGGVFCKGFTQEDDIMAELFEQVTQILGHVVIEKELHPDARAICRATSKSISPRWSS